jgi:uncharacterized protein
MSQYSPKPTGPGYSTTPTGPGYSTTPTGPGYPTTPMESRSASPDVLGLGMLGFATLILGCYYASFIIPFGPLALRAVGALLMVGGIVGILAGMWAFRRNSETTASIFSAYGGFLATIGFIFLPTGILLPLAVAGNLRLVLGLFFLCWAVFAVVLSLNAIRTSSILGLTMIVLALAYLFLAFGHFANDNIALLRIGGWIAIISAVIAMVGVAFKVLGRVESIQERFGSAAARQHIVTAE